MNNILFIGNSYTYFNDLPAILTSLAESVGIGINTNSIVKGGATLEWHLTPKEDGSIAPFSELGAPKYDFVVLQEQSDRPAIAPEAFLAPAKLLCDEIKGNGATPVFYSTWAKKEGHNHLTKFSMTPKTMTDALSSAYCKAANDNGGLLAPVGKAFLDLTEGRPEIELYNPDRSHPSYAGSYLAALIMLAVMFGADPEKCTFNGELDLETANILRKTAKEAVLS